MLQPRSIILAVILFALAIAITAQDFSKNQKKIRDAVEIKDHSTAINKLKEIQKDNSKLFKANNYDYLLARLSEKQNDLAEATANYQSVIDRNSILKEYALWHLSQIMRSTGNLLMERLYLQEFSVIADNQSLLTETVQKRFVRSHLESGNFETAIKLLNRNSSIINQKNESKTILDTVKENLPTFGKDIPREDMVLLAKAYLQSKQTDKAREIYNELINNFPRKTQPDDYALAGAKGLDKLDIGEDNFGKSVAKLSDDEHYKRALIYQFNRNFPLARLHYQRIIKNYPTSNKTPVSIFQIARGYGQERNYEKAVEWSEKLQKEFPEDDLASAALYQAAGAFANLDNSNEAVKRYVKYIDENPDADNLERAYLNIIDAFRDEANVTPALEWTARAQETFKGEMGEAVALFSQIRIHIARENWQKALNDLNRIKDMKDLGGINIAGGTNREEVTYLRGFVLEQLERIDEAFEVYRSLGNEYKSYYSWRAFDRQRELLKNEKTSKTLRSIKPIVKAFAGNVVIPGGKILDLGRKRILQTTETTKSHKTIADELLFLGLYDEATPELETALRKDISKNTGSLSDFQNDVAFTLAVFYKRGDMANRAISYIEPKWKKVPDDYPLRSIPREHLELLYPKPYEESLIKYGEEYNVDPRFLLSIMRQESRFQADVKSFAAARGLMQFISTTAEQMAEELKIENFKQNDLYDSPTAIRFGSHYINRIFKDFPEQPHAVAASYNGGEDRMMRWFKRAKSDNPDRYVPEVVFSQTKDYVYKVMTNYRIYKMLYDDKLKEINK